MPSVGDAHSRLEVARTKGRSRHPPYARTHPQRAYCALSFHPFLFYPCPGLRTRSTDTEEFTNPLILRAVFYQRCNNSPGMGHITLSVHGLRRGVPGVYSRPFQCTRRFPLEPSEGFKPSTLCLQGRCSIN